jgi:proteasome assembly chaperone (PAC2) family protein
MDKVMKKNSAPKLKDPYLIAVWPGMGKVAYKLGTYLVSKLNAVEFARLEQKDYFYPLGVSVKEGLLKMGDLPCGTFYYYKNRKGKHDLIIFLSDAQPDLSKANLYCQKILDTVKKFDLKMVFTFAAMPLPIDHTQSPGVWAAATNKELLEQLKKYNIKIMAEGQISGLNGLFLGLAKENGFEGICLLGEIPIYAIQIENPKSSLAILEILSQIIEVDLDKKELVEEARHIEDEIDKLIDYLRVSGQSEPIGEDEIQRLKKSLSQYTKLPSSVKEKIEKLFERAKDDISKANELKQELDNWSVYKEYEDRFLDLFKRTKDRENQ